MKSTQLQYHQIAVPKPLSSLFTYSWHAVLEPGVRVMVPFGTQTILGVVVECCESLDKNTKFKIRSIKAVTDKSPMYSLKMLEFAQWLSSYYHHPLGLVLASMLPQSKKQIMTLRWSTTKELVDQQATDINDAYTRLTKKIFQKKDSLSLDTVKAKYQKLSKESSFPLPSLKDLAKKPWILISENKNRETITSNKQRLQNITSQSKEPEHDLTLTGPQQIAYDTIYQHFSNEENRPVLLHGITGSGKTEIYLHLIKKIIFKTTTSRNDISQALVMVPEIALTPQMTKTFERRFPGQIAVVHSAMNEQERWQELLNIHSGQKQILIGPRSAVFAPFKNLKLIVVDEEHDNSYKQQNKFFYHGRDAAIVRANIEGSSVILGSATPSLESFWNAQTKKYHLVELNKRISPYPLPSVLLTQCANKTRGKLVANQSTTTQIKQQASLDLLISSEILDALKDNIQRKEQAIVVVNRRGYAHYLFDTANKKTIECPNCNISLTLHQAMSYLKCHYCLFETTMETVLKTHPQAKLIAVGSGSQKAESHLKQALPQATIVRLDSDATTKKNHLHDSLQKFTAGDIDILVGTQMIAKGHDFPKVTLVVLLEVDHLLNMADFRAGEKTFQLLVQASGRAGRDQLPGRVLIQTSNKEHFIITSAIQHHYHSFAEKELSFRKVHQYPPFNRMIQVELSSTNKSKIDYEGDHIRKWFDRLRKTSPSLFSTVKVLGPFAPSVEKLRGRYRKQILLCSKSHKPIHGLVRVFSKDYKKIHPSIRLHINPDPNFSV